MSTPETNVKRRIDAILKPYVLRGVLAYDKTAGSMYGSNGWPDYACCLYGFFFGIEAKACPRGKTKPGKTSPLQDARIESIHKAGGTVLVIHETNLDELRDYLSAMEATHAGP